MYRVYLDTNIVSRIFDGRLQQADADALAAIADRSDVRLAASAATRSELANTLDPKRRSLFAFAVRLLENLQWETVESSVGGLNAAPLGAMPLGGTYLMRHPMLLALEQVFDAPDSLHIAQARLSGCEFFLTIDRATILSRRGSMTDTLLVTLAPLELCDPPELVRRLNALQPSSQNNVAAPDSTTT